MAKWDQYCAAGITGTGRIPLDDKFREYIETFDFSIVWFNPGWRQFVVGRKIHGRKSEKPRLM